MDRKLYPSPPIYLRSHRYIHVRRWLDEMTDTHLHPHDPYAMGALDFLSNVIVKVSTTCSPSPKGRDGNKPRPPQVNPRR
jgi:hypothetical protein